MIDLAFATFAFNLGLRTLPVSVYAATTRSRVHPLLRAALLALACAALAVALSGSREPWLLLAAFMTAVAYFAAASCLVYGMWRLDARAMIGAPLLIASCLALFLVIPSTLLRGPVLIPVVVLGFDRALAAYSYLATVSSAPRSLRECLFFMLVDPTVAYARRTVPSAPGDSRRSTRSTSAPPTKGSSSWST